MPYQKHHTVSGGAWSNYKETLSESGCRVDIVYGTVGVGDPHGHIVYFNGQDIYRRDIKNLQAFSSGGKPFIEII